EKVERGAGGEFQLTDALAALIGRQPFHAYRYEGERFDCGDKLGFLQANIAFGLARADLGPDLAQHLRDIVPTL
ncbi:UTP--glucose-1-phosphate uridylyltransferase, partial [Acinetobacter baumannii]